MTMAPEFQSKPPDLAPRATAFALTETAIAEATPEPSATATATATLTPTVTPEPPYALLAAARGGPGTRVWGLQFGLEFDAQRMAENYAVELPRAHQTGLRSVRTTLRWDQVEPANTSPERFDWASHDAKLKTYSNAGFDILLTLVAYPGWATEYQCGGALLPGMDKEWREFVREAVERYSVSPYRVAAWEIGNEVDGESVVRDDDYERPAAWGGGEPTTPYGGCWGGRAAAYTDFMRQASEAIKARDPGIPVLPGSLAFADVNGWFDMGFLDAMLASGAAPHFDILGYHWFPNVRDAFPNLPTGPETARRLAAILSARGVSRPLWLTETYRFSVVDQPDTRRRQIDFLTRELPEVLAAGDIRRIYWYSWADFPPGYSDNERGIVDFGHQPKLAFPVLAPLIELSKGGMRPLALDGALGVQAGPDGSAHGLILWSSDGAARSVELPAPAQGPIKATWFPADMLQSGQCCAEADLSIGEDGLLRLEVGPDPRFLRFGE